MPSHLRDDGAQSASGAENESLYVFCHACGIYLSFDK